MTRRRDERDSRTQKENPGLLHRAGSSPVCTGFEVTHQIFWGRARTRLFFKGLPREAALRALTWGCRSPGCGSSHRKSRSWEDGQRCGLVGRTTFEGRKGESSLRPWRVV